MSSEILIKKFFDLIRPIVIGKGLELYHIEFVKESGENYLRIYIDSPNGITFEDCEKVSRAVSETLDVEDPISDPYYLEVSSPGIDRTLFTDVHLEKYIGSKVVVKLSKLFNGKKILEGELSSFDSGEITIKIDDENIAIPREKIKNISLKGEF
jgi:ribosome maturation factor RimP